MAKPKRKLRVAIIVDPYGAMDRTGAEEVEDYKETLTELFKGWDLAFQAPGYVAENLQADLVVFDFGGMSIGNDLLWDNSRRLVRWLQDHPSALVVIGSTFTYRQAIVGELTELGLEVPYGTYKEKDEEELERAIPNLMVAICLPNYGFGQAGKRIKAWFSRK